MKKKEKSFSDALRFEEFLNSETYKQISITRRNQIMEGYELIETNTSEVHKIHYDKHGFDTNGIHKDTGFSTDKYGNRKDYYLPKNK